MYSNHYIMKELTKREEEIMQVIWDLEKAFVKEVRERLPEPRPHYNTVSTIVRNLEEKGYLAYEVFGNTHRYYPLVSKKDYLEQFVSPSLKQYFDNSFKKMVAFFAKEEKISVEELKDIIDMIEKGKNKK